MVGFVTAKVHLAVDHLRPGPINAKHRDPGSLPVGMSSWRPGERHCAARRTCVDQRLEYRIIGIDDRLTHSIASERELREHDDVRLEVTNDLRVFSDVEGDVAEAGVGLPESERKSRFHDAILSASSTGQLAHPISGKPSGTARAETMANPRTTPAIVTLPDLGQVTYFGPTVTSGKPV